MEAHFFIKKHLGLSVITSQLRFYSQKSEKAYQLDEVKSQKSKFKIHRAF